MPVAALPPETDTAAVPPGPALVLADRTPAVLGALGDAWALLNEGEVARVGRLRHVGDREDFVAAHGLARLIVGTLLGVGAGDLDLVQRCDDCGGPHGKPTVQGRPDVGVSLSHSHGYVAAAAAFGAVGIDVERSNAGSPSQAPRSVFTPAELAGLDGLTDSGLSAVKLWTRKEALIKAAGLKLDDVGRLDVSRLEDDMLLHVDGLGVSDAWAILEWSIPAEFTVGAAIARQRLVRLELSDVGNRVPTQA